MIRGTSARPVLPETSLLAAIGSADLLSTIYLLATNQAIEMNPLLASALHAFGPAGFILCKFLFLAPPLAGLEMARPYCRPEFVRLALRLDIACYCGVYVVAFLVYNLPHLLH
jgi:hypothetical protein